ncbi:MAG: DNA-packaging protein [Clostridia bacterium]|nr:DNA-packaging protein [Clostridia bacterium]
MEEKEKKTRKPNSGQFKKGNEIGKATRAKPGDKLACKYKPEYGEQMLAFFTRDYDDFYPTFQRFAVNIGVVVNTLLEWCEEYPQFANYYERCKALQLDMLTVNAMNGKFNPNYAKFEAINNHGLREKQEIETNVSGSVDIGIDDKTLAMIERVGKRLKNGEKDGK